MIGGASGPSDGEECRNYSYLNQTAPTGFTNNWLESRHNDQLFAQRYGDFPLYDEPRDNDQIYSNEQNNSYRDILKSIQVRSPLSDKFFSKTNLNHIKYLIAKMVKNRKGYDISAQSQSDNELLIIMRSMFLQHAKHLPESIDKQLSELNMKVLMDIIPRVESNIQMELTYQRDHGSQPLPLPRPLHISSAGTRSNRSVTDLFV